MSNPIDLIRGGRGFLLVQAVYRGPAPANPLEAPRGQLAGIVAGAFRTDDLEQQVRRDLVGAARDVRILDVTETLDAGDEVATADVTAARRRLISSRSGGRWQPPREAAKPSRGSQDLLRLADGALYTAKQDGRNRVLVFSDDARQALSAEEQAERLRKEQTLMSLRILARIVDAKDPLTQAHSVRVATLAAQLAQALG